MVKPLRPDAGLHPEQKGVDLDQRIVHVVGVDKSDGVVHVGVNGDAKQKGHDSPRVKGGFPVGFAVNQVEIDDH